MIGSGLKKLASQYNMTVAHGMAYGVMNGCYATMDEGAGWKRVTLATKFPDPVKRGELMTFVNARDIKREFRVLQLDYFDFAIVITFHDNPGTMKCIAAFLDWFMPLFPQYGATGTEKCPYCGMDLAGSGTWKRIGSIAAPFHSACAVRMENELNADLDQEELTQSGSYVSGFVGALIGGLIGAILWGVLLNLGYIAAIVGFVIGWLAEKGYNLLRGKKGTGKLVILIIVAIVSVAAGTALGMAFSMVTAIGSGELPGITYGDIPYILVMLFQDSEFLSATLKDMILGMVFAGLGIFSLLRRTKQEVSRAKLEDL